ncbi:hypothetical protein O0L34_g14610 [Tuta absoluta]|nr:hypothetical protein O0L34_g14610 [Tuta absoluta]
MSFCATRLCLRITTEAFKYSVAFRKGLLVSLPSTAVIQKRSFFVLPCGLDVGIVASIVYGVTKLKKPDSRNVLSVFGPLPGSTESEILPDRVVKCIAHRGAGDDAPENTLEAFKYCIDQGCSFFEFDVRSSKDGKLVLLHDDDFERVAGTKMPNVRAMDWESISKIDVGINHPNRQQFKSVHPCLLDEALDYLLKNNARMIIDIKGDDTTLIEGILRTYRERPDLYANAAVASFNPFVLYQIRKKDPEIVSALSYRPYAFSAKNFDAETGPNNPKTDHLIAYAGLRLVDTVHSLFWRRLAHWCGASAVLLHKDIVSRTEVQYWRNHDVRCLGWCINTPVEKMYWDEVLKAPYMANTLQGEPSGERKKIVDAEEEPPTRKTVLE